MVAAWRVNVYFIARQKSLTGPGGVRACLPPFLRQMPCLRSGVSSVRSLGRVLCVLLAQAHAVPFDDATFAFLHALHFLKTLTTKRWLKHDGHRVT